MSVLRRLAWAASSLALFALGVNSASAQDSSISTPSDARSHGLESLKTIVESEGVPLPDNLGNFVRDRKAAERLGKALFHDQAIGSDGVQACVTCHFKAGADPRAKNQLSPGLLRVKGDREGDIIGLFNAKPDEDKTFQIPSSGLGANYTLDRSDFPIVKEVEAKDALDDDVVSSMGVVRRDFVGIDKDSNNEDIAGATIADAPFEVDSDVGKVNTRRVEPRNTPTTINAIFNFFNFWDGRANPKFNGENPFGKADKVARIFKKNGRKVVATPLNLKPASLASQASGPPGSHFEMSFGTKDSLRSFPDIGRKMLTLDRPLLKQDVHKDDSLLGSLSCRHGGGNCADSQGLNTTYEAMIQAAFNSAYWDSPPNKCLVIDPKMNQGMGNNFGMNNGAVEVQDCKNGGYNLMESNFSFFFSVAVMLYEATLVSDETPFDNWMRGSGEWVEGFGEEELKGLNLFVGKGKCVNCHGGPELTNASVRNAQGGNNIIEPMLMGDRRPGIYDNGFYNIGVTPTKADRGRGDNDPFQGAPLSSSRQFAFDMTEYFPIRFPIIGAPVPNLVCDPNDSNTDLDSSTCDDGILGFIDEGGAGFFAVCKDNDGDGKCGEPECEDEENLDAEGNCGVENVDELLLKRVAVDGAFKTPGLRNVAETAPYFHNGGSASLLEVVEFYDRGGNFCETNGKDLDPDIQRIGFEPDEETNLVKFMVALTDPRVVYRKAPFDGPSYLVPNGHKGDNYKVAVDTIQGEDVAKDDLYTIIVDAVGRNGGDEFESFADHMTGWYGSELDFQLSANAVANTCSPNFPKPEEPPVEEEPPEEEEPPKEDKPKKGKGRG